MDGRGETIVALATAAGRGAISVIRLSGEMALAILSQVTCLAGDSFQDRQARLCRVWAGAEPLDHAVVVVFRAPRSYTGEDVAEISCHGSPWIVEAVIGACVAAGARVARPGEFTERAFLNGRLDLTQAEALNDLIRSQTAFQAAAARRQMEGALSLALSPVRRGLVDLLCQLETALEFVEEDVSPEHGQGLVDRLDSLSDVLRGLLETWTSGRVLREGGRVVLTGRPNVGKSSLFNRLVREERALVASRPGTTRDAIREYLDMAGVPVWLVDTAGLRGGRMGQVEELGVLRSREQMTGADLVLLVADGSRRWSRSDEAVRKEIGDRPYLVVLNKIDLGESVVVPAEVQSSSRGQVRVSAVQGTGIEELVRKIAALVCPMEPGSGEAAVVTSARHRACLEEAVARLESGRSRLVSGWSEEVVSYELRGALASLEELVGTVSTEEVLGRIFSTFCIGK